MYEYTAGEKWKNNVRYNMRMSGIAQLLPQRLKSTCFWHSFYTTPQALAPLCSKNFKKKTLTLAFWGKWSGYPKLHFISDFSPLWTPSFMLNSTIACFQMTFCSKMKRHNWKNVYFWGHHRSSQWSSTVFFFLL